MMNNKGQVLVLFLLLIPVFALLMALVVDSSLMIYNKKRIDSINSDVLTSIKNKTDVTEKEIRQLIDLNDEDIVIDKIVVDYESITIENHKKVKSIFGNLIGFKEYTVTSKKKIKYSSNLSLSFEIDNGKVHSLDGRRYTINNNRIELNSLNLKDKTLEVGFTNLNNYIFVIGTNTLSVNNNILYLNGTVISTLNKNNIIDIVENKIYLNDKYITETSILNGKFIVFVPNIKYVKIYNELLSTEMINRNYNNNRSWLDEE